MAKSSFFSGTGTTSNDVDSVTSSKAAAAASATNAATSETNAAASASSASTSATNASTSASNASNSATAAATSENNAASSATAASASQTSATNSASAAATSATNAATSEANAATSNTNAASSATAAATSATSAATSLSNIGAAETNAANSATAAATSATNASTSATNAATSETNAATSATTASTAATNASTSETNAATSATNAATSKTNAATSETNAATSATSASTSASAASTSATAAAASQSAAAASAASAASAYDTFDDRYLGSKTADPTVDNDGNALVSGALYFNSTANEMRVYDGANWIAATSAGNASLLEYKYTATSGQTTFSGADDSANTLSYTQNNLIVTLNGVVLENGTDYTATTGTSVVLASGAATSDELNVIAFKSFTTADMVSSTNGGTFYNDIAISGDLTVDTNVLHVDSTNNRVGIGTTSPSGSGLHIRKDTSATTNELLRLSNSAGSTTDGVKLVMEVANTSGNGGEIGTVRDGGSFNPYMYFSTSAGVGSAPIERMRIDSSGNVGIGTSSPNNYSANHKSITLNATATPIIDLEVNGTRTGSIIAESTKFDFNAVTSVPVRFLTADTERMRIDSNGYVGIGTSSPDELLHIHGATQSYIKLTDNDSGQGATDGALFAFDGSSATQYIWNYENGPTVFATNSSEAMRIDSSGNLLVGKTTTSSGVAGIRFAGDAAGYAEFTRDGGNPLFLNRETDDGHIIRFAKDNSYVGSIGVSFSDNLYIANNTSGHGGIMFGSNDVIPMNGGSLADATTSLGESAWRWKDLYLSGGVYLGGTNAANKLDDYEEGSWTPAINFSGGATGVTYARQQGVYVKTGSNVFVALRISLSSKGTSSGEVRISGLPFAVADSFSDISYEYGGTWGNWSDLAVSTHPRWYLNQATREIHCINLHTTSPNSSWHDPMNQADFSNTTDIRISFSYKSS